jgi:hypothetical protein
MQRDLRTTYLLAEVPVPAQRKIFDAISGASSREAKSVLTEVEEVLLAERVFVQLHEDQVSGNGDFADGLARHIPFLSICGS